MTQAPKPLDAALDLFVFVPVGLAVTAAEELPKLAAKGRSRVTTRLTTARVIGQFAVAQGRQMIEKRFEAPSPAPAPSRPARPAPPEADSDLTYEELLGRDGPVSNGAGPGADAPAAAPATVPAASPPQGGPAAAPARPRPRPRAADLTIPGYDSLSASQVVQRLAGLSGDELAAVGAYEEAHRGRRTILNRIGQLQAH